MAYAIKWTDRGVEWIYSGTLTGAEIIQSNEDIYGDPRFDELRYEIVDFTQVEKFEVSEKQMTRMAHLDAAAARSNPNIRLAVIAPVEAARQVSDAYSNSNQNPPWEHKVFETREEAEAWLKL